MDCSFCGKSIEQGTERIFVTKKGKASYFCSSKCEKNLLKLGRKPRKTTWTAEYRKEKAIRLRALASKEEKETTEKKPSEKATKKKTQTKKKSAKK